MSKTINEGVDLSKKDMPDIPDQILLNSIRKIENHLSKFTL